jgi:CBS domain-containing protein
MQPKLAGDHQPCVKVQAKEERKKSQMKFANRAARPVKNIIEPAKTVRSEVSVQAALNELQAREVDSSPVTDQRGELLGAVSKNELNRKVGGMGHDPKTEPVEAHVEKDCVYCFEDHAVAEAEQIMLDANVAEAPVVTREKLVVGTTSLEAIAQDKKVEKPRSSDKSRWLAPLAYLLIPLAFAVAKIFRFLSRLDRK